MNTVKPFAFIHPDSGLESVERRGECARLLYTLFAWKGQWIEAFALGMQMHSLKPAARMNDIKKVHGPSLIEARDGRKAPNGKPFKEYRLNPRVIVIEE